MMLLAADNPDGALTYARGKVEEAERTEAGEENGKEFSVGMKLLLGQILSAVVSDRRLHSSRFSCCCVEVSHWLPALTAYVGEAKLLLGHILECNSKRFQL